MTSPIGFGSTAASPRRALERLWRRRTLVLSATAVPKSGGHGTGHAARLVPARPTTHSAWGSAPSVCLLLLVSARTRKSGRDQQGDERDDRTVRSGQHLPVTRRHAVTTTTETVIHGRPIQPSCTGHQIHRETAVFVRAPRSRSGRVARGWGPPSWVASCRSRRNASIAVEFLGQSCIGDPPCGERVASVSAGIQVG
jgi:hypothetical protein